jgi:hypothetical protein
MVITAKHSYSCASSSYIVVKAVTRKEKQSTPVLFRGFRVLPISISLRDSGRTIWKDRCTF